MISPEPLQGFLSDWYPTNINQRERGGEDLGEEEGEGERDRVLQEKRQTQGGMSWSSREAVWTPAKV